MVITPYFDLTIDLIDVAAAELGFISDVIPRRGVATGVTAVRTGADGFVDLELRDLEYRDGESTVNGFLSVLITGDGPMLRNVELETNQADVALLRPFLDSMPFAGWVTGRSSANGPIVALDVDLNWTFRDRLAVGTPDNFITAAGRVALGGEAGLHFDSLEVTSASIALETVRVVVPGFDLEGRMGAFGGLGSAMHGTTS